MMAFRRDKLSQRRIPWPVDWCALAQYPVQGFCLSRIFLVMGDIKHVSLLTLVVGVSAFGRTK